MIKIDKMTLLDYEKKEENFRRKSANIFFSYCDAKVCDPVRYSKPY